MRLKVTLKEIVGTKIIYALLLACYYWMWARRDWQGYYATVQHVIIVFTIVFFALQAERIHRYGKEGRDELEIQKLHKIDAFLLKILVAANVIIAFASAVTFIDGGMAGCALIGTIFIFTVIRFILFCVMIGKEA